MYTTNSTFLNQYFTGLVYDNRYLVTAGEEYWVYSYDANGSVVVLNNQIIANQTNQTNQTVNDTNSTSANQTANNQTIINWIIPPDLNGSVIKDLFIGLKMDYDWSSDTMIFTSNLTLSLYGCSHTSFSDLSVSLEGELQTKTSTGVDTDGNFILKILPERVYDFMNFKRVNIYFPGTIEIFLQEYRPRIILKGK